MDTARHPLLRRLAERQRERAELEQQVRGLQARFREEIAPLKERMLRLRTERLRTAAQARMRSARLRNAYHDAQRAYESFRDGRARASVPDCESTPAFRQASKQCHPDRVPDDYRGEAEATFQALKSAHTSGHAQAVRAIAQSLEEWGFPARAHPPTTRGPQALREAIGEIEASIQKLRATDAHQLLERTSSPDAAIRAWKQTIRRQLRRLEEEKTGQSGPDLGGTPNI